MTESDVRKPITRRRVSKSCVRCGTTFEVIQARKDSARYCGRACFSNRRSSTCETCGVAFDYPASAGQRRFCGMGCRIGSQRKAAPEGMKWCSMGQHFTTIQSFGKSRFRRDGLLTHCKPCKKAYETSRAEINRGVTGEHIERAIPKRLHNNGRSGQMRIKIGWMRFGATMPRFILRR
jgi:hypothetical protein